MIEVSGANALPIDEVMPLLRQAEQGDRKVLPALRKWLDTHPAFWDDVEDLAQAARRSFVKRAGGDKNLLVQEVYDRKLTGLAQELAGPTPSPLERLLVERIVLCWLHLYYAEAMYVQHMQDLTLRQADFHQQRISKAHSRYLSAIRTLAQVRRLGVPAMQVNIGAQQVNVAP
jgi:hypothetical protein